LSESILLSSRFPSSHFSITGGRVLTTDGLQSETTVGIEDGRIAALGARSAPLHSLDAGGLLVLPGIVDLHGDAFERQLMPRPGVRFDPRLALLDTDRQLVANGITTAFHAVTYSWEPGLRGAEAGRAFVAALAAVSDLLGCDTRLHLRWETFNLDVVSEVAQWLADGTVALLAFNDHTPAIVRRSAEDKTLTPYAERSGLSLAEFRGIVERVATRRSAVPGAIERLASAARAAGVPMASHDDDTLDIRRWYHTLGCRISEFPQNEPTARLAHDSGCDIVMGAPNVVRGGSHLSLVSAADMIAKGLCTVLSSDYYYTSMLNAAFRLASDGVCSLATAWRLISENPARAGGLHDRGQLAEGQRADLILVDDSRPGLPRVVATIVAGRPVFLERTAFERDARRLVA
jgi:alpha-D-ribose 1-methylphosphonate 5-triphosphate diphosphatase